MQDVGKRLKTVLLSGHEIREPYAEVFSSLHLIANDPYNYNSVAMATI